jgi:phosphoglycerol transferase MdoB-like AlkP superfamily enzyme
VHQLSILPDKVSLISQAFLMGWRFDTAVSGYILALPLVVLSLVSWFGWKSKKIYSVFSWYLIALYLISFLICSADIPYFNYFFSRITVAVLEWTDWLVFIFKMGIQEFRYFAYFFVFMFFAVMFTVFIRRLTNYVSSNLSLSGSESSRKYFFFNVLISLVTIGVLFVGIRGRIEEKSPLRVGTAYFSNYAFPNQLGLNPVFTFIRSYFDSRNPDNKELKLIDDYLAISNVCKYLKIDSSSHNYSPIARYVQTSGEPLNANIVLVIMESMSASKMKRYGNRDNLTPVLDSLANNSYCFDNIYTAGIHTCNGIFSTLFSYPALLHQHPMKKTVIPEYTGLPKVLSDNGYQTIFFTTHDEQFDNVSGFLHANNVKRIVSEKDYPAEKIMSTLGVTDDYMFEFSVPILTAMSRSNKPFFAAFMTSSDHGPYIIPKDIFFVPRSKNITHRIIEYADWSIGKFLDLSSKHDWFNNTIFVFVADHGAVVGSDAYDMPLSYLHTPLIIYAPKILKPKYFESFGGQIDIFPTVMGILNLSFINNTLGIDLVKEERPYIYFSADDRIGCLSKEFFYVYRTNGIESLYRYKTNETKNYLTEYSFTVDSMRTYAFSMLQASQWLIKNGKTGVK